MRTCLGLAAPALALALGLALAASASAQNMADYAAPLPKPKPKPKPQPTTLQKVASFTAKALNYNTYLPPPGSTNNSIKDPRLLPNKSPSETLVDVIDVVRPHDFVNFNVPH
jgi:hypothetical protein